MHERLEPEIMRNYGARTDQVNSEPLQPASSLDAAGTSRGSGASLPAGAQGSEHSLSNTQSAYGRERASGASQEAVVTNGRAAEASAHQGERNLSVPAGAPSQEMREDFRSGSKRINEQAAGAGIQNNVANQVAAQRSGLMETLRENDGKIAENKSTVQTSSDILKHENDSAKGNFKAGHDKELNEQGQKPKDNLGDDFDKKIKELRRRAG